MGKYEQYQGFQMSYNYHKRLTGYLSESGTGLRRAHSQQSFISAANSRLSNVYRPKNNQYRNGLLNTREMCGNCHQSYTKNNGGMYSFQNSMHKCNHQIQNQGNGLAASQYFAPEIQTIRNTLIDIRDQMRNGGKLNKNLEQTSRKGREQYQQNIQQSNAKFSGVLNSQQEAYLRGKIFEKQKVNQQLTQKIQELEQINFNLNQKINQYREDNENLQTRIRNLEPEFQKLRERLNNTQSLKNRAQERERALQIQIMDMKAEIMRNEQVLREFNFREEQNKQSKIMKKVSMGTTQEFNVMVNWKKEDEERASQTYITDTDIMRGYKEVNEMQDLLCNKINGNLKVEKKIFARIGQIDDKLSFAYDRLYQIQEIALKMGIPFPNN